MEDEEPKKAASIETPGHRAGPRALALSSDDAVLLSAAAGEVKLWNPGAVPASEALSPARYWLT